MLPVGLAFAALYCIPILLTLWIPRQRLTVSLGLLCATLSILDLFLSPDGGVLWMGIVNRFTILVVTAGSVALVERHRRMTSEVKALQGLLPICAWCKNIRDDKGFWSDVEAYLQKHTGATFTHRMCPACKEHLDRQP